MEGKNICVLLGSPRNGGNSDQLATAFIEGAQKAGHRSQLIRTASLKLSGCLDCRGCWSQGTPCVQKDDVGQVYTALETADIFVFATPLYFYSWSAQIKPAWDRLVPYFAPNAATTLKNKSCILLATAAENDPNCFDGLRSSFKHSCSFAGWDVLGEVCATGVYKKGDILEAPHWLQQAEKLGSVIV